MCLSFPPGIPIRGAKSTSSLVSGQQGWNRLQKSYFSAGISIQMRKVTYLVVQRHRACAHGPRRWRFVHVCFWVPVCGLCPCSVQGMRLRGWCEQDHGTILLMSPAEGLHIPPKPASTMHRWQQIALAIQHSIKVQVQVYVGQSPEPRVMKNIGKCLKIQDLQHNLSQPP